MSYDTVIRLDKYTNRIIDVCDVAFLDLAVHSKNTIYNVETICQFQQSYDRLLEKYNIDKSKNVQESVWNIIRNTSLAIRRDCDKVWLMNFLLRQKKKFKFLTHETFICEIVKEVKKSADKPITITRLLKSLHLLQYCKREDLQYELKTLFTFFIRQLKSLERPKQQSLVSKATVEILKVFCVSDFMKIIILYNPVHVFRFLLKCSKRQNYNFCGIFEDTETDSYPIAWALMKNCLPHLRLLLILGARNLHTLKIHCEFYQTFYLSFTGYRRRVGDWIFNLHIYNRRSYLVMQVMYLYIIYLRNVNSPLPTEILVLLWRSIPDPFLNHLELSRLFENKTVWAEEMLYNCWKWYNNNVICKESSTEVQWKYSPRSLKHLARCAARKNLAANYVEPPYFNLIGEVPKELQKYLQIEL